MRAEFSVNDVFLVSSGSAALVLALTALKSLTSRTEVVIPAYTCFSVPAAVLKAGLTPVLCDIDPATFDFDHVLLEQALGPGTLCVIAHHLFGVPSDVERLRATCAARGVFVVEDAAQAMGVRSRGRQLGTIGDVGIFSFGRGKNVTCGSGGAIVTTSRDIAAALARQYGSVPRSTAVSVLKDFVQLLLMTVFIRPRLYWIPAALPWLRLGETIFPKDVPVRRLSGMKAGFLRDWRNRLVLSNDIRSGMAAYYRQALPVSLRPGALHPYVRLPILAHTPVEKRRLHSWSKAHGLGLSSGYPTPISDIPEVSAVVRGRRFPHASHVAANLLTLPTHEWLSDRDKRAIAALCRNARTA